MDPAEQHPTMATPEVFLSRHKQAIQILLDNMAALSREMRRLANSRTSSPSAAATAGASPSRGDSHARDPEPFNGDLDKCRGFLLQCPLIFSQRLRAFLSDEAKINYILGLLRGRALTWAQASCTQNHLNTLPLGEFLRRFRRIYDRPNIAGCASDCLFTLQQGSCSVAEYAVEFGTLAAEAGWDEVALRGAFQRGLTEQVHDALVAGARPVSLRELIDRAIELDNYQRRQERARSSAPPRVPARLQSSSASVPSTPLSEGLSACEDKSMQLGRARLSVVEQRRRLTTGLCLYCGQEGHHIADCSIRPKD